MIAVMIAAATAMFFSLLGTRFLIRYFRRRGAGQPILGKEDRGPEHHMSKQGTPTMGGLAIVGSAGIGWVVAHLRPGIAFATQSLIMWVGVLVLAGMGLLDDVIKVRKRHNRGIFSVDDRRTTQDFMPGEYQRNYTLVRNGTDKLRPNTIVDGLRSGNLNDALSSAERGTAPVGLSPATAPAAAIPQGAHP